MTDAASAIASMDREGEVTTDEADSMNLFLNAISPGTDALAEKLLSVDSSLYEIDPYYWFKDDTVDAPGVVFHRKSFGRGIVHRIIVLAAHELGRAAQSDKFTSSKFALMTSPRRQSLRSFARLVSGQGAPFEPDDLKPWAPAGAGRALLRELAAVLTVPPPVDLSDVAVWVTQTERLDVRAAVGMAPA